MSYNFTVITEKKITKGQLMERLLSESRHADFKEEIADQTPLEEGKNLNVPGKSTRPANVSGCEEGYNVRLNVFASKSDWEVGIAAANAIAKLTGGKVKPESEPEFSAEEFWNHCNDAWIESHVADGAGTLRYMISSGKGPIVMYGVNGQYTVGAELLKRLRLMTCGDRELYQGLISHMLQQQNKIAEYFVPSRYTIEGDEAGKRDEMIMWCPQIKTYLYKAKWVVARSESDPEKKMYRLKFDDLIKVLQPTGKITLADECNWFAEKFTDEEADALMKKLAPYAVQPRPKSESASAPPTQSPAASAPASSKPPKPWWKFW